jgi:hypothetical protein
MDTHVSVVGHLARNTSYTRVLVPDICVLESQYILIIWETVFVEHRTECMDNGSNRTPDQIRDSSPTATKRRLFCDCNLCWVACVQGHAELDLGRVRECTGATTILFCLL